MPPSFSHPRTPAAVERGLLDRIPAETPAPFGRRVDQEARRLVRAHLGDARRGHHALPLKHTAAEIICARFIMSPGVELSPPVAYALTNS